MPGGQEDENTKKSEIAENGRVVKKHGTGGGSHLRPVPGKPARAEG